MGRPSLLPVEGYLFCSKRPLTVALCGWVIVHESSVNARGRALNAALGSLHSYDRSLDKFMAWLSDTESSLESLELELDSYGPGVKTSRERTLHQLKVGLNRTAFGWPHFLC
jgi:hypothetical protein